MSIVLFNSREAMAAIIGDIVVFFTIQRICIVLVRCRFLRSVFGFFASIKKKLSTVFQEIIKTRRFLKVVSFVKYMRPFAIWSHVN